MHEAPAALAQRSGRIRSRGAAGQHHPRLARAARYAVGREPSGSRPRRRAGDPALRPAPARVAAHARGRALVARGHRGAGRTAALADAAATGPALDPDGLGAALVRVALAL